MTRKMTRFMKLNWQQRLAREIDAAIKRSGIEPAVFKANCSAIGRTLDGFGPDSTVSNPFAGARVAINISSAHIPDFCRNGKWANSYKNCYDLEKLNRGRVSSTRRMVDEALPLPPGKAPSEVYFGAIELNGSGIRFYGDVCLILKLGPGDSALTILDRNSYDIARSPYKEIVDSHPKARRADIRKSLIGSWSGKWKKDLSAMAAIKLMPAMQFLRRRLTIGQIGERVLNDEDYLEVIRIGSFGVQEVQEARASMGDAALEGLIASRIPDRPLPRFEALIWRRRRQRAERMLREEGILTRVVTAQGRVRG